MWLPISFIFVPLCLCRTERELVIAAILFGSISTLADTSEIQRRSFNEAFAAHGLDWVWDRDAYVSRLDSSGGAARIAAYAEERGESVDVQAVHGTKSKVFQQLLASEPLSARPGVVDAIQVAKRDGVRLGLVTTTSAANVTALLDALSPEVTEGAFDVVVTASDVSDPKPDPAAYRYAMEQLGETPQTCVAVEDNVGGARAADAAGVRCVAFPNENTAGHDFDTAVTRVDRLDSGDLNRYLAAV
ncbi:HAD-IA family hydrolase [Streptomyces sp. NPDC055056]